LFPAVGLSLLVAPFSGCSGNQGAAGPLGGPDAADRAPVAPDAGPPPAPPDAGSDTNDGGAVTTDGCPDILGQDTLRTFSVEISNDEWAKITVEFLDTSLQSVATNIYHPAVFHYGQEVVSDAMIRLKGQSSRVFAAQMGGASGKMQFVVAFDQVNPSGNFHGMNKMVFDMPFNDNTFLHERVSNNWFRSIGIAAPCSTSGRLEINGQYYGLYAVEESVGHHLVKEFFPDNSHGDLFSGGTQAETNKSSIDIARLDAFWAVSDFAGMSSGIIDLDRSLDEWAVESLLVDSDGYYGGSHNFLIYDQGAKGWVWLPHDVDATLDYIGRFDVHPFYWWEGIFQPQLPGSHYLAVINDPAGRKRYVDAIARQIDRWDVAKLQSWIDDWSAQIADAVAADPHKTATTAQFQDGVALARRGISDRALFLKKFVACERNGDGADADGDGVRWCDDCRDDDPAIHPGAHEVCGNKVDDNCDGRIDEGCPR
jgi:hypothetical protein